MHCLSCGKGKLPVDDAAEKHRFLASEEGKERNLLTGKGSAYRGRKWRGNCFYSPSGGGGREGGGGERPDSFFSGEGKGGLAISLERGGRRKGREGSCIHLVEKGEGGGGKGSWTALQ